MGKFDGILLTSDWDGTLCYNGEVSKKNIDAINYFMENGGKFSVCSGRYLSFFDQFSGIIKPNTYLVTLNGALIIDPETKEKLHEGFCDKFLFDIIQKVLDSGIEFLNINFYLPDSEPIQLTKEEYLSVKKDYMNAKIYKILFRFPSEEIALKAKALLLSSDMRGYTAMRSWNISLEIMKSEHGKDMAIRRLKEALGVKTVVSVGDFENDIEMLKTADIGYAVGNATEELKSVADKITVSAESAALAKVISDIEKNLLT